jgi:hypothetical protein
LSFDVSVDNAPAMNILKGKAYLNEPIEHFQLSKDFIFADLALNVVGEISD